jgi:hypothetical protein
MISPIFLFTYWSNALKVLLRSDFILLNILGTLASALHSKRCYSMMVPTFYVKASVLCMT